MFRMLVVSLFLPQILVAQTNLDTFIQKTVGKFEAVNGSADYCQGPYNVKFHSKKEAVLGEACGAVLWMSSPSDPMGVFFCNADSILENKTIGLNFGSDKNEKPDFYISDFGKINDHSIQIVFPAKGNEVDVFSNPETLSYQTILSVTELGIDVVDSVKLRSGVTETIACKYEKISK